MASSNPSVGHPAISAPGSVQGSFGLYYEGDGSYNPTSVAKAPKKKPPMHKGGKPSFLCPQGTSTSSAGGYQSSSPMGQSLFDQYGQGMKSFSQNQGGTGVYSYSTAYPSQVTGGGGGSQDFSYEGELRIIPPSIFLNM